MMPRTFIALLFIAGLSGASPVPALAQTCTPGCGSGTICAYTNLAETQTGCIIAAQDDGTVDEVVVEAAGGGSGRSFAEFVYDVIVPLFNDGIIPLLYALAFLFFLIGVVRYFFLESEENREKGKGMMLWGIIGLAVIFSVWGLVQLLLATFSLGSA
ncbi:MAG TPA: pilin [Candidatus Paceibacterota bacterium]|nr:pilin [Candidatus Paceibacterota bacterium]